MRRPGNDRRAGGCRGRTADAGRRHDPRTGRAAGRRCFHRAGRRSCVRGRHRAAGDRPPSGGGRRRADGRHDGRHARSTAQPDRRSARRSCCPRCAGDSRTSRLGFRRPRRDRARLASRSRDRPASHRCDRPPGANRPDRSTLELRPRASRRPRGGDGHHGRRRFRHDGDGHPASPRCHCLPGRHRCRGRRAGVRCGHPYGRRRASLPGRRVGVRPRRHGRRGAGGRSASRCRRRGRHGGHRHARCYRGHHGARRRHDAGCRFGHPDRRYRATYRRGHRGVVRCRANRCCGRHGGAGRHASRCCLGHPARRC